MSGASRTMNKWELQGGTYRVDVLDTWNMTVETVAETASGPTRVVLPTRKYMAVRIQKNK
jgi:hypothetical protein